jgi:hypothetical protein
LQSLIEGISKNAKAISRTWATVFSLEDRCSDMKKGAELTSGLLRLSLDVDCLKGHQPFAECGWGAAAEDGEEAVAATTLAGMGGVAPLSPHPAGSGNESAATSGQSEESRQCRGKPGVVHDSDLNFSAESNGNGDWDDGGGSDYHFESGNGNFDSDDSDESLFPARKRNRRKQVLDESETDTSENENESANNEAIPVKRPYVKRNHESKAAQKLFKKNTTPRTRGRKLLLRK